MTDESLAQSPPAAPSRDRAADTAPDTPKPAAAPIAGIGALGAGAIGGALAAVIGIAIVGPLLRRRKAKKAARSTTPRRPRNGPAGEN